MNRPSLLPSLTGAIPPERTLRTHGVRLDGSNEGRPREPTDDDVQRVRSELRTLSSEFAADGLPAIQLKGQLLRPLIAFLALPPELRSDPGRSFWCGALALQMIHEASLIHDDIVDGAEVRRGERTAVATIGVGPALVWGDHLLTAAYRIAFQVENPAFSGVFVRAVERTVAGEVRQARSRGARITGSESVAIAAGKSGELFGAALALAASVAGESDLQPSVDAGIGLGVLYQRIDDLLDCCPQSNAGKPAFQDYTHQQWTWVFEAAGLEDFSLTETELHRRLFSPGPDKKLRRSIEEAAAAQIERLRGTLNDPSRVEDVVQSWVNRATAAVTREKASVAGQPRSAPSVALAPISAEDRVRTRALALGGPSEWRRYFRRHSRTFSMAARLFPKEAARSIEGLYAFCRFTDDLVDGRTEPADVLEEELHSWTTFSRAAYDGHATGIPLLDEVLGHTRSLGVPFTYAEELIHGVAMDLRPRPYRTLADLRLYTHRVASVVGLWMTESFGRHDAWTLSRAAALGHAMQLTNILRDVGEDLEMGRLYLPEDMLAQHGLARSDLLAALRTASGVPVGYSNLIESLMAEADRDYQLALNAIPALPRFAQRPIAVAARVYQGIHERIRENGYDNLGRRAHTRPRHKARLALQALRDLGEARRRFDPGVTVERAAPVDAG